MTVLPAGILLPETVLGDPWFQVFAAFVAFNTIVYLGLTLSKMVVWPRQARLKAMASKLPVSSSGTGSGSPMPDGQDDGAARDLRAALIAHDVPVAIAWLGGILIVLNLLLLLIDTAGSVPVHAVGIAIGVVLLAAAQVMARVQAGPTALAVAWVVVVVGIAAYLASPLTDEHTTLALAFLFVLQTAFGFTLVSWQPFLVTAVLTMTAAVWAVLQAGLPEPAGWMLLSLAALGVGALLLRTRLTSIEALEEAQRLSQRLATTDPLTGMLSRSGMESILPRFIGTARRSEESICAMYFRIDELDRAVTDYGRDYGDAVLTAVAGAVRDTVREGDLVSRWSADAFLVVGFGLKPDEGMLRRRIQSKVEASGVDLGKWPVIVGTGAAAGLPDDPGVMALIEKAEVSATAPA